MPVGEIRDVTLSWKLKRICEGRFPPPIMSNQDDELLYELARKGLLKVAEVTIRDRLYGISFKQNKK